MKFFKRVTALCVTLTAVPFVARGAAIELQNPLNSGDVFELIQTIISWLIAAGAPIATIMIIIGAFQIMTAQGDPKKFTTGKNTILYAALGYGIIFIGWGIVGIIEGVLE